VLLAASKPDVEVLDSPWPPPPPRPHPPAASKNETTTRKIRAGYPFSFNVNPLILYVLLDVVVVELLVELLPAPDAPILLVSFS
jgi:hypothetical protein